mgnify:CR=1 FL=1
MPFKFMNTITSKNKGSFNYFKYALGEIFLVAFGILIALQVNNSNENRKRQNMEITILKNLQEDINLDTLDVKFNIQYHKKFFVEETNLLKLLQNNFKQHKDSINFTDALGTPLVVALHASTYQNLQNNKIGILSNNNIRKDIARFYDFFHKAITILENDYSDFQTYTTKKYYFKKYFRITQNKLITVDSELNDEFDDEEYYNPNIASKSLELYDLEGAKNDEGFKIELNQSLLFRNLKIGFYEDMLIRTKVLSKKLQNEINRLENK